MLEKLIREISDTPDVWFATHESIASYVRDKG